MDPSLPRNPNPADGETSIIIYGYIPSLSLGLACTIIFGVFCLAQLLYGLFDGRLFRRRRRGPTARARDDVDEKHIASVESATSDADGAGAIEGRKRRRRSESADVRIFCFLLSFGCLMEAVGYAFRVKSYYNPFLLNAFILQYFMIVCAPVLFTAAIYLGLATIIRTDPALQRLCPLGPRVLIALFVIADTITIIMQVAGAALFGVAQSKIADNEDPPLSPQAANNILTAGLAAQTFFFTVFLIVFAIFVFNLSRQRTDDHDASTEKQRLEDASATTTTTPRRSAAGAARVRPDRLLLATMAVSSFFIYLRTIFRLAEAIEGIYSQTATDEGFFAGLEAAPVLVAVFVWTVVPLGWRISRM